VIPFFRHGLLVLFVLAACVPAPADPRSSQALFDPQRHMSLAEVTPGMKGYGLSVFRGTKIERFEVEVVSILKNAFAPGAGVIMVRCSGQGLEHTGAVQGMSGSPIYLRDEAGRERLAGAFAYGWPMSKDPLVGVQPIERMLGVAADPETGSADGTPAAGFPDQPRPPAKRQDGAAGARLTPLLCPMSAGGLSRESIDAFSPYFRARGIELVASGSADASGVLTPPRLEPGATLMVQLAGGDMDLSATGTVTEVIGDRIYAFGHPMFGEGNSRLPMGSGVIGGIVASYRNSFKLGGMVEVLGTVEADQSPGILCRVGDAPPMTPVSVRVVHEDGDFDQTYRYTVADHPVLTPLVAALLVQASMEARHNSPRLNTVEYSISASFRDKPDLEFSNRMINGGGEGLGITLLGPLLTAGDNPFDPAQLSRLEVVAKVQKKVLSAELKSAAIPRSRYRPGESVEGFMRLRPFRGEEVIRPFRVQLPNTLPDGTYNLVIADSSRHLADEQAGRPFRFRTDRVNDVFEVLRETLSVRTDAVYLRLVRSRDAVAVGRVAMPGLPASKRKILADAGRSDVAEYLTSDVVVLPQEFVVTGSAELQVIVDRKRPDQAPAGASPRGPAGATQPARTRS
jgi:hypothetical protein